MRISTNRTFRSLLFAVIALVCALAMCLSLSACGSSAPKAGTRDSFLQLADKPFTAKGELGQKPVITFKTPYTVENFTYQTVQMGKGRAAKDGDMLCLQQIVYNPKTGKQINSTWEAGKTGVCSTYLSEKSVQKGFYKLFKGMTVNSTVVLGVTSDSSSNATSSANQEDYLLALTLIDARHMDLRATGSKVSTIDPALPKVTLGRNGEPSISGLTSYKSNGKLVSQTLLQGNGTTVKSSDSVTVQYKGWVLGGDASKPFDSSWKRGYPISFSLSGVIKGWRDGLAGKKVGSQVLIIVPPDQGYGSTAQAGIPANSTLVFVVDILAVN